MLMVNQDQLHLAGIASLEERCIYCSKRLAAYPLIANDDGRQTVYHITCALELASDLLADVFTFFSPPAPYPPLFVLTPPDATSAMMARGERAQTEGGMHAISEYSSDEGSTDRSGVHWPSAGVLRHWGSCRCQTAQGPAFGSDTRLGGTLVFSGQRADRTRGSYAFLVKERSR